MNWRIPNLSCMTNKWRSFTCVIDFKVSKHSSISKCCYIVGGMYAKQWRLMLRIGFFQVWVQLYFMTFSPTFGPLRLPTTKELGHKPNKNVQKHFNSLRHVVGLRPHIELNS